RATLNNNGAWPGVRRPASLRDGWQDTTLLLCFGRCDMAQHLRFGMCDAALVMTAT
ncbi:hypothetical protein HAX54_050182, partial [Datura stramonium]|nr:hypothetical protein [Datura stramonium]